MNRTVRRISYGIGTEENTQQEVSFQINLPSIAYYINLVEKMMEQGGQSEISST